MKIPIQMILTNYTAGAAGEATLLARVGASTNGATIMTNSVYLLFGPTNNLSESFTYVVRDVRSTRPGDTVLLSTNWINISVSNAVGYATSVTSSGGAVVVRFAGVPGFKYVVERTGNLTNSWTTLDGSNGTPDSRTNAPSTGIWLFTETPPYSPAFYRVRQNN
jgi:hypothetical protein